MQRALMHRTVTPRSVIHRAVTQRALAHRALLAMGLLACGTAMLPSCGTGSISSLPDSEACTNETSAEPSDPLSVPKTAECVLEAAITSACRCSGMPHKDGYCCSTGWQQTSCAAPTAQCTLGAAVASVCLCCGVLRQDGYCCSTGWQQTACAPPPPPECAQGMAIASACLCGGVLHQDGYCCSTGWQQTACAPPPANCTPGAVIASGCLCSGVLHQDGYCCSSGWQQTACAPQTTSKTLQVQGRFLLDTCGNHLFVRGPEQLLGYGMEGPGDAGGHYNALIDQIAGTGANALRLLPNSSPGQPFAAWTATAVARLDEVLARACTTHNLVVYLSYIDENESGTNANARANFWSKQAVKDLVNKYSACIVVDGLQEVAYWNVTNWRNEALAAVDWFRAQGYTQPLDILANAYGRDLPAAIQYGPEIVARDPLKRVIIGWQAYWGQSYCTGDWAGTQGLSNPTSPADGIRRISELSFPVQAGLLNMAEPEMELVDYQAAMTAAQTYGIGWFWWWGSFNDYVDNNILTNTQYWDQSHLRTPYGPIVVWTHPASFHNSSVKACVPSMN